MIGGEEKYVLYLHPYQVTDLRTDAATAGNWFDIQSKALQGGAGQKSPLYTGALGEYNGVILRSAFDVSLGGNSATGAAVRSLVGSPSTIQSASARIQFTSGYVKFEAPQRPPAELALTRALEGKVNCHGYRVGIAYLIR